MSENGKVYGQGYLAQGNGDFIQCTNYSLNSSVDAKQISTLRKPGAGVVNGVPTSTVSFELVIDGAGPERNFHRQMIEGEEIQLRCKVPGTAPLTLNGHYSSIGVEVPLDDAVKYSVEFVGHLDKPRAA